MAHPLTVLIPTHGRATLLARTLDSLAACDRPKTYRETVVVENGPPAGARDIVARAAEAYPRLRLRYLHVERANKSHALNEALATVEQGLVVFFDDDVRLSPGVLVAYAEAAAGYPGHGAYFGGPFGVDYEERPPEWLIPLLPWSARGLNLKTGPKAPFYLGFNWAAFSSDIHRAGGFNPNYGPGSPIGAGGQETEMQRRMRGINLKGVDVLEAHVWHYVPCQSCTPEWALQRAYRAGLTRGVEARRDGRTRMVFQQVKRVTLALPDVVPHLLRRDSPEWYKAVIPIAWPLAIIRAYVRPPRPALQESKRLEGTEAP